MKQVSADRPSLFYKAFNLSVLEKDRMPWIDYLKGIAIILVVYRHVLIGIDRTDVYVPSVLISGDQIFYSFRMPLLFILSGIFINSSIAKRGFSSLVRFKFDNLLYPYLIWAFLHVSLQIITSNVTNANRGFSDYIYILYHPRNLDQFWYLPALFNTTVLYVLMKNKLKAPKATQLFIGLVLYFLAIYCEKISMISDVMRFYFFFVLGDVLSPLLFRNSTQKFLKSNGTLLWLIPLFIGAQAFFLYSRIGFLESPSHLEHVTSDYLMIHIREQINYIWISSIGCLAMFVLAFRLQARGGFAFLRILGYHSLHIYVMHVMIAAFVRIVSLNYLGVDNYALLLLIGMGCGLIVPIVFYNLLVKDNFLWFLFSYRRKQKKPAPPILNETKTRTAEPNIAKV